MRWFYGLLALVLVGCASTPDLDTFNKRYAAAEISWQTAMETILRWESEGRLTQGQKDNVTQAVQDWRIARTAINNSADLYDKETGLFNANAALILLQEVLREVEQHGAIDTQEMLAWAV